MASMAAVTTDAGEVGADMKVTHKGISAEVSARSAECKKPAREKIHATRVSFPQHGCEE